MEGGVLLVSGVLFLSELLLIVSSGLLIESDSITDLLDDLDIYDIRLSNIFTSTIPSLYSLISVSFTYFP